MQRTLQTAAWRTALGLGAITLAASLPVQAQQTATPPALTDPFMRYYKPTAGPNGPQQSRHKAVDGRTLPIHYTHPNQNNAPTPPLQLNHAYGNEGVHAGQTRLQPFGTKGERATLAFGNGEFSPPANEKIQPALARLAMIRANAAASSAAVYALLLLNTRLDESLKAQLEAQGVELFAFYPHTAYQVRIPVQSLTQLAALPQVRWIGQPTNTQKMTPELTARLSKGVGTKPISLFLSLFGNDPNNQIRQAIEGAGAKINLYDPSVRLLQADADPATLGRLLEMDAVLHVEEVPILHTLNERSMSSIDVDWLWGSWDPAPSTTPVHLGLTDSGSYVYHEDFTNVFGGSIGYSLISGENWYDDLDHHGTHVSGTMMGEGFGGAGVGVEAGRYRGIAAELTSHGDPFNHPDFVVAQVFDKNGSSEGNSMYQGLQAMNGEFSTPAVQLFNLSGGGGGSGQNGTDSLSIKTDALFQNNILPVIAAGNSGSGSSTILYPGAAKGALTVGAVYSDDFSGVATDNVTGFSSRGPTGDGRVKPDVCAPGAYIDSTLAGTYNSYTYGWAGTSMATPHVTGMAAGFIGQYGFPAWATKTTLLASAINVGQSIYAQGEGKIDAMLAHYNLDGGWSTWWWSNGGTGSLNYVDFTLGSAVANLKVVMTYPDVPPAQGASIALVNDLDLYLQTDAFGGSLTTDRGYNWVSQSSVDPVEVINVPNAPAGHYRIKVYTYNQASGSSQNWAVTAKTINSSTTPHLSASLSTPYAVQPGQAFYAQASTSSNAYVASGVNSALSLGSSGASLQGLWYNRPAFGSSEWFWYPNPDDGSHGSYSPFHMNEGNIPAGYSRAAWWQVGAGSSEGVKTLSYTAHSINSTSSTGSSSFIVDGTPPSITNVQSSNWGAGTSPTVTATAQDTLSGLQPAYAYYRYSTDGGSNWSSWISTGCTGSFGTTSAQTITATSVAFGQNNTNNKIQFGIYDGADNFGTSAVTTITSPVPTSVTFSQNPVVGGSNVTGTVTLSGAAPTGGALVSLSSANAKAHVPATVTVPAGSSSANFTITTLGTTSPVTGNITATYAGGSASGSLTVRPIHIQSFTLSPNPVKHKLVSTGTVTLEIPVPSNLGSLTVSLSSSNTKVANPAVGSLTFTTGQQTLTFSVNTFKKGKATITATAPDGTAVAVLLKVK